MKSHAHILLGRYLIIKTRNRFQIHKLNGLMSLNRKPVSLCIWNRIHLIEYCISRVVILALHKRGREVGANLNAGMEKTSGGILSNFCLSFKFKVQSLIVQINQNDTAAAVHLPVILSIYGSEIITLNGSGGQHKFWAGAMTPLQATSPIEIPLHISSHLYWIRLGQLRPVWLR